MVSRDLEEKNKKRNRRKYLGRDKINKRGKKDFHGKHKEGKKKHSWKV